MKVQKTKCNQCLFTKNRIVTSKRKAEIIKDCLNSDTYFCCHKTKIKGIKSDVCCRGFWDTHKSNFNLGRIAQGLNVVKEVIIK